ncbi:MAG: TatD family hydrolase [Clostridia bacterium]|nr:TatD family hydrolase [Clostridia bacterium]
MKNIFDSHAHYDNSAFDPDREELLARLPSIGVTGVINCGCDLKSSLKALELAEKYDYIFAAVGIHGLDVEHADENELDEIKKLYSHKKAVAVGEIGLDYHYSAELAEKQKFFLRRQLETAVELDLPVIIHDREAHADTLALLTEYRPRGVVHCFSGSVETAKEVLKLGMYIGLGGAATFKNAKKPLEVAAMVPDDRLLIETDCPYMTPVPFRGKRNDSSFIPYSASVIAAARKQDAQQLLNQTAQNARQLFIT